MTTEKTLEDYAAERKQRREKLEKLIPELQAELAAMNPAPAPKWSGKLKRKERFDCECRLIGNVLQNINYGDVRELVTGLKIRWRWFADKRHQAIWRALETLNTRSIEERMKIIEEEMLLEERRKDALSKDPQFKDGNERYDPQLGEWEDILRGFPGSAKAKDFKKALIEGAGDGLAWLEREIEAAGMFSLVGGKVYLRELAKIENRFMTPKEMAGLLFEKN